MEYSISGQESKQCVKVMLGANPNLSNSTAKIKHYYGFIAWALSIVGKMVACIEMHHQSGREPNGRTHHIGVLDKAVATKEGTHSTVNCGDYSVLTVGKAITFAKVPTSLIVSSTSEMV